ncbi:gibberellin 3-beta-dioxygenase 3-like [Abrus precatorius]|uniref:Gibberellin 3-beta-dioxygenase 3-like n=1 Tax=Abrus precatorius TaxID=3816 RepID=A0A8B8MLL9_ABRPR|nr:gibberellin 3-beta-dioxygenase 3-like [Abrus precatorius]
MNSITNSYKNNPSHVNHRVPLDFSSVLTVPDSHEWVFEPHTLGSVPLINLSDPNAKSLVRQACEEWGVFQVINHGVSMKLLKEVEVETFRLFSLPTHQKICALRSPDGIIGYGVPRISSYYSKLLWCEGFSMMESPVEHATQLWPHQPDQQTTFWYLTSLMK